MMRCARTVLVSFGDALSVDAKAGEEVMEIQGTRRKESSGDDERSAPADVRGRLSKEGG